MTGSLARKLAVAVTAVIVIVDIALIGTAVRGASGSRASVSSSSARTAAYPAPEMVVPTRLSASVRLTPAHQAPARTTPAPAPVITPPPSAKEGPTIEVLGESKSVEEDTASAAVAVPVTTSDDAAARVLLAVGAGGLVLRATRGACPADSSATLELSTDSGRTFTPLTGEIAQVLRVDVTSRGRAQVIATDRSCRPLERHTLDGGATWQSGELTGVWYLSPDSDADQVLGPSLVSEVGCVPRTLTAPDDEHAAVACVDGTVRFTGDAGDHWRKVAGLDGVGALTFATAADGYALVTASDCESAVERTSDGGATWTRVGCLDSVLPSVSADAPTAIAAAGRVLAVQVGPTFLLSTDSGGTWAR